MADKDGDAELPRRMPGAARTGPPSPAGPVLSEELRRRMRDAVKAERAEVPRPESAAREEPGPAAGSPVTARSPVNGSDGKRNGAVVELAARTGSVPGDDITEWLRSAAGARTAAGARGRGRPARRRARVRLVALGLVMIVIGALATAAVRHLSDAQPTQAALRAQAAAWVAAQVSPDVTVSCDAVMCAALKADGFPAAELVRLEPTSPEPVPSILVVDTPAVRDLFGSSLAAAWAPAVLALFGSGTGAIAVRVVAPHGAAAYRASLDAGLAARKTAGAALLRYSRVTVSATARSQLVAGQADSRLLRALASLAGHEPIDIVRFGNLAQGASPGVPLRFADLAESVPAAHLDTAAYIRVVWAILSGAGAPVRPARAVLGPVQGQAILRVEFTAPSPLG